ncbi:WD40 repeat domain-containing protein [Micromonospora chokoriensis]
MTRADGWISGPGDESGEPPRDLAVLTLETDAPSAPSPARVRSTSRGHRFRTSQLRGTVGRPDGAEEELLLLVPDEPPSAADRHTLCGEPVWDESMGAVAGLAVRCGIDGQVRMVPLQSLAALWPPLADLTRSWWPSLTDPHTTDHWLPSAQRPDDGLPARARVSELLTGWLTDPAAPRTAVVAGSPGTGRSTALARLLVGTDPRLSTAIDRPQPAPPLSPFHLVIDVQSGTAADVIAAFAAAADVSAETPDELVATLARRPGPFTALVDSVDEAFSPHDAEAITTLLLRIAAECPSVRLLWATQECASSPDRLIINLDTATGRPGGLLIDHLTGAAPQQVPPITAVGEAVDATLHSADEPTRDLLLLLAFGYDDGLSPSLLATSARAVRQVPKDQSNRYDAAIAALADSPLVQRITGGRLRIVHPAVAAHLRSTPSANEAEQAVTAALLAAVPEHDGRRAWGGTDPYLRRHLTRRLRRSGSLDELITDAEFLAHVEETNLPHLEAVATVDGFLATAAYRATLPRLRALPPDQRRHLLAVEALRTGAGELAASARHHLATAPLRADWVGSIDPPAELTAAGGTDWVRAVTLAGDGHRDMVVVGGADGRVRVWDPVANQLLATLGQDGPAWINAAGLTTINDAPAVVTAGADGLLRLWDLRSLSAVGDPVEGDVWPVLALATAEVDGTPVAVLSGGDERLHVWDLRGRARLGDPLEGHAYPVSAITVGEVTGRPVIASAAQDGSIRLWDLTARTPLGGPLEGHTHPVSALAVGRLDDRTVIASAAQNGSIRLWDLTARTPIGDPLEGHTHPVTALAVGRLGYEPVIVSGGEDATVRVWSLRDRTPLTVVAVPGPVTALTMSAGAVVAGFGAHVVALRPPSADDLTGSPDAGDQPTAADGHR